MPITAVRHVVFTNARLRVAFTTTARNSHFGVVSAPGEHICYQDGETKRAPFLECRKISGLRFFPAGCLLCCFVPGGLGPRIVGKIPGLAASACVCPVEAGICQR